VKVELVPHQPDWARMAANEAARLRTVIGDNLIEVLHIGSTSIPGIMSKPVVDLMPLVNSLAALDARANAIKTLGYQWRGEFGLPGRRYFSFDDPATGLRRYNVHAYQRDHPDVRRHLAFRDYLCAHPDQAKAYEAQKRRAAALHPEDVLAYNDAKSDWIKSCEQRALRWVNETSAQRVKCP